LEGNNILFKKQFGFRSFLTFHSLIALTETIQNSLDKDKFTCGISIDLKKLLIIKYFFKT